MDEHAKGLFIELLVREVDDLRDREGGLRALVGEYQRDIATLTDRRNEALDDIRDLQDHNGSLRGRVEALDAWNDRLRSDVQQLSGEVSRQREAREVVERLKKDPIDLLPTMEMDAAKAIINRIVDFLGRNEKIPAIKWLREELYEAGKGRFGLKEAKDVVDVVAARLEAGTLHEEAK